MSEQSQKQEMQDAKKEERIPKCLSCNHELRQIIQTQYVYVEWTQILIKNRYEKMDSRGDANAPTHRCTECTCEHRDWDFLDENSKADLGVNF